MRIVKAEGPVMAKIDRLTNLTENEEILWQDRKRYLGLPLSFTIYSFSKNKFYMKTGIFNTKSEEILLYRILDITYRQSFGQKIFGVGSVILNTADKTTPVLEIRSIRTPDRVRKALSTLVEQRRDEKRVTGKEMFGAASSHDIGDADLDLDGVPDYLQ